MKKLAMQTPDLTEGNIEKIKELFPNVITEKEGENGVIEKAIDFELLKQLLSKELVEDDSERYRLDWPGKKASLLKANTPITSTLRPDRESSVNFDTTENVFIEGDNFEVLKVLQESYLGKIKMIYIDPPYNTGTAMIYNNDFSQSNEEFEEEIGAVNEEGIKMFKNTDSNGRFHSDWLSMMYERIIVARDLLTNDGFIGLAIDNNELQNLISICDEIFSEENRLGIISIVIRPQGRQFAKFFSESTEYMLVYAKNKSITKFNGIILDEERKDEFSEEDEGGVFKYEPLMYSRFVEEKLSKSPEKYHYPIYVSPDLKEITLDKKENFLEIFPINKKRKICWKVQKETFRQLLDTKRSEYEALKDSEGVVQIFEKYREEDGTKLKTHWIGKRYNSTTSGTGVLKEVMGGKIFDYPKSLYTVLDTLKITTNAGDLIMDFFAGSATTAHAAMQLNAEDGGNRRFVMVQLPEETDKDSEAYKAGYKTISEISMERIRRAGKKIIEENKDKLKERETPLDIGFRVYKTDTTNMKDVYYHPSAIDQKDLFNHVSNIKEDRTPEDLLTQVILDLGLTLDLPIEKKNIKGNDVYFVSNNSLVACFDDKIDFSIVDEIAKSEPLKVVFKDASFKEEQDRTNIETKFKRLSPETIITVL